MTNFLAKTSAQHPWRVISAWVVISVLAGVAALTGLGQGGLFSRMHSDSSISEGTETSRASALLSKDATYTIQTVIHGAKQHSDIDSEFDTFLSNVKAIDGVESVLSAPTIKDSAIAEAKQKAAAEASQQYEAQSAGARQAAEAQAAPQIQQIAGQLMAQGIPQDQAIATAQQQVLSQLQASLANAPSKESVIAQAEEKAEAAALEQLAPTLDKFTADDGYAALIVIGADQDEEAIEAKVITEINNLGQSISAKGASVDYTSANSARDTVNETARQDLIRGEIIGMPVALILLVLVFGGILTALMPIAGALVAILITLGGIWGLTFVMGVDSFVLNVVSIIGLALSIDYGLLVVSRYREEINRLQEETTLSGKKLLDEALNTTVETAGRTVIFSAVTIAVAIAGLFTISSSIMRVIAIGGFVVVIVAVLSSVSLVPALLSVSGEKLLRPSVIDKIPGVHKVLDLLKDKHTEHGVFSTISTWVQKRPWLVTGVISAILIAMVVPIKDVQLRTDTDAYISAESSQGKTLAIVNDRYPDLRRPAVTVLAQGSESDVEEISRWLATRKDVEKVNDATAMEEGWYNIGVFVDTDDPVGPTTTDVVKDIRAHVSEVTSHEVLVTGQAAVQHDFNHVLAKGAPWALSIVIIAVLVLLFLLTGSVLIPIKAIIINALSLAASLGLTMFLFENGLFGLPQTEGLTAFVVACGIAFGFGLAMDYEVFLVARMKEYWDSGENNDRAVSLGLQRSGRIITSAAAIIVAVFLGFCFGDMLAIKEIGVLLAITVVADATLTRMLLVPATMTLMGKWNWWAPPFLSKIYRRFGISEGGHHRALDTDATLEEHQENTAESVS